MSWTRTAFFYRPGKALGFSHDFEGQIWLGGLTGCSFSVSTASMGSAKGCALFFFFFLIIIIIFFFFIENHPSSSTDSPIEWGWNQDEMREKWVVEMSFSTKRSKSMKNMSVIFTSTTSFDFILEDSGRGKWSRAWGPRWSCWWEEWLEEDRMDLVGQQLLVHLELATVTSRLWPWNHLQQPRVAWKNLDINTSVCTVMADVYIPSSTQLWEASLLCCYSQLPTSILFF